MMIVTTNALAPKCWSASSGMSGVAIPSETASGRYARNQRSLEDGRSFGRALMSIDVWRAPGEQFDSGFGGIKNRFFAHRTAT
jgi:hypothetical protein